MTLDMPNSYTVDDGLNVAIHTDMLGSNSQAKAQVTGEISTSTTKFPGDFVQICVYSYTYVYTYTYIYISIYI